MMGPCVGPPERSPSPAPTSAVDSTSPGGVTIGESFISSGSRCGEGIDQIPPGSPTRFIQPRIGVCPEYLDNNRLRVGDPWVEASDSEWFEVSGVAGDDGHVRGLRDCGDEGVVERGVLTDPVGGQDPRGGQIERQHLIKRRPTSLARRTSRAGPHLGRDRSVLWRRHRVRAG